jgi:hypothetical protein
MKDAERRASPVAPLIASPELYPPCRRKPFAFSRSEGQIGGFVYRSPTLVQTGDENAGDVRTR